MRIVYVVYVVPMVIVCKAKTVSSMLRRFKCRECVMRRSRDIVHRRQLLAHTSYHLLSLAPILPITLALLPPILLDFRVPLLFLPDDQSSRTLTAMYAVDSKVL